MPFVQAKCCNCGANLEVNSEHDAAICKSCGTPFIVEKAINYFISSSNGGSVDFEIVGGVLKKYVGPAIEITIPDNVLEIGENAFSGLKYIQTVTFPKSIRVIAAKAFKDCSSLQSVRIPDDCELVSIGESAFYNCKSLKTFRLPKYLKTIEESTFMNCSSLKYVTILDTYELQNVKKLAFCGCTSLEYFHDVETLKHFKTIEENAFWNCIKLKSFRLPDNENIKISPFAFRYCWDIKFVFPSSYDQLMRFAFYMEAKGIRILNEDQSSNKYFYFNDTCYESGYLIRRFKQENCISLIYVNSGEMSVYDEIAGGSFKAKFVSFVPYYLNSNYMNGDTGFNYYIGYHSYPLDEVRFESDYSKFSKDLDIAHKEIAQLLDSAGMEGYSITKIQAPIMKKEKNKMIKEGTQSFLHIKIPLFAQ